MQGAQEAYQQELDEAEQHYNDTHEAPYEGNFSDSIPFKMPKDHIKKARKAGQDAINEQFIPQYKLDKDAVEWVLPQILAHLTKLPLPESVYTIEGKINGAKVCSFIFDKNNAWDLGLYQFLMMNSRSSYLDKQYKSPAKQYCSLVPLILYAFKLHQNIPYSKWSREHLRAVVHPDLCDAMLCTVPDVSREELLEAQHQGLIFQTGKSAGEVRNSETTYRLYNTHGTKIHDMPQLAQTIITQIWCAHPKARTKYMILDCENWDRIPPALIDHDVFKPQVAPSVLAARAVPNTEEQSPWF